MLIPSYRNSITRRVPARESRRVDVWMFPGFSLPKLFHCYCLHLWITKECYFAPSAVAGELKTAKTIPLLASESPPGPHTGAGHCLVWVTNSPEQCCSFDKEMVSMETFKYTQDYVSFYPIYLRNIYIDRLKKHIFKKNLLKFLWHLFFLRKPNNSAYCFSVFN